MAGDNKGNETSENESLRATFIDFKMLFFNIHPQCFLNSFAIDLYILQSIV